jgi:hypothetical protein
MQLFYEGPGLNVRDGWLKVGIEVSNINAPWANPAAVFDERDQNFLNEIPELPHR